MPIQGQDWEAGTNARVSGWGTLASGGDSPCTLHAVDVPVLSDVDCEVILAALPSISHNLQGVPSARGLWLG